MSKNDKKKGMYKVLKRIRSFVAVHPRNVIANGFNYRLLPINFGNKYNLIYTTSRYASLPPPFKTKCHQYNEIDKNINYFNSKSSADCFDRCLIIKSRKLCN